MKWDSSVLNCSFNSFVCLYDYKSPVNASYWRNSHKFWKLACMGLTWFVFNQTFFKHLMLKLVSKSNDISPNFRQESICLFSIVIFTFIIVYLIQHFFIFFYNYLSYYLFKKLNYNLWVIYWNMDWCMHRWELLSAIRTVYFNEIIVLLVIMQVSVAFFFISLVKVGISF